MDKTVSKHWFYFISYIFIYTLTPKIRTITKKCWNPLNRQKKMFIFQITSTTTTTIIIIIIIIVVVVFVIFVDIIGIQSCNWNEIKIRDTNVRNEPNIAVGYGSFGTRKHLDDEDDDDNHETKWTDDWRSCWINWICICASSYIWIIWYIPFIHLYIYV